MLQAKRQKSAPTQGRAPLDPSHQQPVQSIRSEQPELAKLESFLFGTDLNADPLKKSSATRPHDA